VVRGVRGLQRHREPARGADRVRGGADRLRRAARLHAALEAVTLRDAIRDETGIDILTADELPGEGTWAKRVDSLLSHHVEPKIRNPTFILDYPKELSPFAKDHRSEPGLVERFEAFAGGWSSPTPSRS
jgi:lysyl-tRNA synthetase class II